MKIDNEIDDNDRIKEFEKVKENLAKFLINNKVGLSMGVTVMLSLCASVCASSDDNEAEIVLNSAIKHFKIFIKNHVKI